MKQYLRKIVRFFSDKPIIGWPIRILSVIARLPQIRDEVFKTSQQVAQHVAEINRRIDGISSQLMEMDRKTNEISHQINVINHQLETLNVHQHLFNTEYLPNLLELLEYQNNLKKSLPVVLRQHRRSMTKQKN